MRTMRLAKLFSTDKCQHLEPQLVMKGDEVLMNYGSHPNDYLLVEYGFFLDRNESDAVYLDDIMCQDLSVDDKEALRSHGYYG
ncbi:hypothetical protein PENARI_c022G03868 [Penicillium arizonense]|uniref:SET domain-containing protein n=1 Tax=Penicillium arizonense TaxID=1835702 RepID=A0A1F5L7Z1_PENAI|nr:hypothetical protein PENARI_c022G03868 [Penicillium arizonense]OGE49358.1 hypothetical protein PENARI_c022G03868 [Penicillium arizonense]